MLKKSDFLAWSKLTNSLLKLQIPIEFAPIYLYSFSFRNRRENAAPFQKSTKHRSALHQNAMI